MEDDSDYSKSKLELCSYRYLQQLAKSMKLPSNVKKVYLAEMINAKKCSPEAEVQRIVRRVKQERKHLRQTKKRSRRPIKPHDSSDESPSPPITVTPKRQPLMTKCFDLRQQTMQPRISALRASTPIPVPSDRVLRSNNVKTVNRPYVNNYVEVSQTDRVELVDQGTQMNVTRVVKKYKPKILASNVIKKQAVPVTQTGSRPIVVRRPRLVSGVYPLGALVAVGGVAVRATDGKMAALNAFVRRQDQARSTSTIRNIELTLQDVINGNVDAHATNLNYPNTSGVTEAALYTEVTPETTISVYYHKKIRAEQVRERRKSSVNTRWFDPPRTNPERSELPRFGDAFEQFRGHHEPRDVTPLRVRLPEEPERMPQAQHVPGTCLLEKVYNLQLPGTQPRPPPADTKCVFSTPVVSTAVPHRSATSSAEPYVASYERDNQYYGNTDSSRMDDCLKFDGPEYDFRCHEEHNTSGSSVGTIQSQELGANVTISDMVEDALELISQDGDYMERMGMDVKMQCVLCNWAGPKIILEYHIRKEHSSDIDTQEKREWNITYTLGSIVSHPLWRCRVIAHGPALYVLGARHAPPGRLLATLSSLSPDPEFTTGSITIFNKVTGEPHTWCGDIHELPPSLPYDTQPGLQVDLAKLDLIPNSANLKFQNGELVLQSPTKVIFGALELDEIHIILFVKISD